jgi:catechol 2,3-dioxygenase-like lactoylglutathione lyase family enzyme
VKRLLSHIDLRVRDRERATVFYDALFAPLGMRGSAGAEFTSYSLRPDAPDSEQEWFGFTQDAAMVAGSSRISFAAESRELVDAVAEAARAAGAGQIEGPALETDYGPTYYAVFFEDPDGNKLEVCCLA